MLNDPIIISNANDPIFIDNTNNLRLWTWTLLVSAKPGNSPPFNYGPMTIVFADLTSINTMWKAQSLALEVNNENYVTTTNVGTTQQNHVAIVYDSGERKLTFWVNGKL